MITLYHVAPSGLPVGSVIQPGRWGQQTRAFVGNGGEAIKQGNNACIVAWETGLESARIAIDPNLPSRFECVFTCKTLDDARSFRDRFRPGWSIYEVECADKTPRYVGNYDAITNSNAANAPLVEHIAPLAVSYWRDAPTGIAEILVGGPVTVRAAAG